MEDVVRKIRKLLQMTAERGCTEEEAAIATRKVQELLIEHNLSMVEVTQPEPNREVVVEEDLTGAEMAWHGFIAVAVAKVYFCRVLRLGRTLRFVGKAHHTAVAREMCEYLYATVERLAQEAVAKVPGPRRRAFRNSFRLGAATRLCHRLNDLYRQATQPKHTPRYGRGTDPVGSADERLPALYRQEERTVDAYMKGHYGRLHKGKASSRISSDEGYRAGHEAAGSISLNPQIRGGTRAGRRIIGGKR